MHYAQLPKIGLHYADTGPKDMPCVVFANSLGTDFRLWDKIIPHLPRNLRIIRFDKRGHGLSEARDGPYSMGALVSDTEALLDRLEVQNAVFIGLSIGGMIAQGLAVKRPDLIKAMVLSNTGAKIGTREMWQERIDAVALNGVASLADAVMTRWFAPAFRQTPELLVWRNMVERQAPQGYIGCMHAIAGSDFYNTTAQLRLPVLGIAGSEDGSTPPDLVRETAMLVPNADFALIRGVGHLPCVEKPEEFSEILLSFLNRIGHI